MAESRLTDALALVEATRYEEAEKRLSSLLAAPLAPEARQRALRLLSHVAARTGREAEAREYVAEAVARGQDPWPVGHALLEAGSAAEAAWWLQAAVGAGRGGAQARVALGDARMAEGRPAEAVKAYEAALALEPRSALVLERLAIALFSQGDFNRAAGHAATCLAIDPDRDWVRLLKSDMALMQASFREAAAGYREAIALGRQAPEVYENLAGACMALDDPAGALEAYAAMLALYPDHWQAYLTAGHFAMMAKAPTRAKRYFQAAAYVPGLREEARAMLARLAGQETPRPEAERRVPAAPRALTDRLRESGMLALQRARTQPLAPDQAPDALPPQAPATGPLPGPQLRPGTNGLPRRSSRLDLPER